TKEAAQLESSKIFCKDLLRKYDIPTAAAESFDSPEEARAYISDLENDVPIVVKADGLAVGKGVVVAQSKQDALAAVDEVLNIAHATSGDNNRVLVEEYMSGEEVSLMALTDGETVLPLVAAQDHKRIGEGDTGANTGGMGCYSPVPAFTPEMVDDAIENILKPMLAGLKAEGIEYHGVLYAGLMLTPQGTKVVEFNARFGDPETQVVLPRLQSDLLPLLLACAGHIEYSIRDLPCEWTPEAAVCVVMSSEGYPGSYRKGDVVSGLGEAAQDGAIVFHAGTALRDNEIATNGGRVLGVTGLGEGFHGARAKCYNAVEKVHFDGAYFRRDIGWRCL
ncbi:MAG TPA: phosphoribosylamine--glycine ligase, partial [Abditibacteriaceae bacterium]|nr:phosphoribosylamine--glycine ligase [Abditibacteriaceae bacterium]